MKPRLRLNSFGCLPIVMAILGGVPALASPVHADASDKGRRNVLFNYVGLSTVDARFYTSIFEAGFGNGKFAVTANKKTSIWTWTCCA